MGGSLGGDAETIWNWFFTRRVMRTCNAVNIVMGASKGDMVLSVWSSRSQHNRGADDQTPQRDQAGTQPALTGEELKRIHPSKAPGSDLNSVIIWTSKHSLKNTYFKKKLFWKTVWSCNIHLGALRKGTRLPVFLISKWTKLCRGQQEALCLVPMSTDIKTRWMACLFYTIGGGIAITGHNLTKKKWSCGREFELNPSSTPPTWQRTTKQPPGLEPPAITVQVNDLKRGRRTSKIEQAGPELRNVTKKHNPDYYYSPPECCQSWWFVEGVLNARWLLGSPTAIWYIYPLLLNMNARFNHECFQTRVFPAVFRLEPGHSGARVPSRVKRQVRLPKKSFSQLRSSVCRTLLLR